MKCCKSYKRIHIIYGSLIYINDFHKATQYSKADRFPDDTNLFHTSKSLKILIKLVNRDMKHLNNWLSANNVSLNIQKN